MKIFVTGATGFIGRHFLVAALEAGHQVIASYRTSKPSIQNSLAQEFGRMIRFVEADISNTDSLAAAMDHCDCVCHFSSAFTENGVPDGYFTSINVDGTRNVIAAAKHQNIRRFVYCSTAGIYGQKVDGIVNEDSPIQPWNIYESSKVAAENVVREFAKNSKMEYVILRPSAVYGPYDDRLEKLYNSASKGRFPLFGPGAGRRHMVYVGELAKAFLLACTSPEANGCELIIAGPKAVPLREMLQILAKRLGRKNCGPRLPLRPMLLAAAVVEDVCGLVGVKPPIYRRRMNFYLNDIEFDCSLARERLNWVAQVSLEEGFRRTLDARSSGDAVA